MDPDGEPPPTNEAVAQAVQEKVAVSTIHLMQPCTLVTVRC